MTHLPPIVERFDLTVRIPPASVEYAGRMIRMPTAGARLLRRLLCSETVSMDDMVEEIHRDGGPEAVRVNMSRLRSALRREHIPVEIVNERGEGYKLEWQAPLERVPAWVKRIRKRLDPHRNYDNPWKVRRIKT